MFDKLYVQIRDNLLMMTLIMGLIIIIGCGESEPPVADVGKTIPDAVIGVPIQLDGRGSYSSNGESLTYQWSAITKPEGSAATLINDESARPIFIPDKEGDYTFSLVVSDGERLSYPTIVTVNVSASKNQPPQAVVTAAHTEGVVGDTILLDGSNSSDPDGDTLTYHWTFKSKPVFSKPIIEEPKSSTTKFVPDKEGTYVVQLVVNDGKKDSPPSTVKVEIHGSSPSEIVPGNRISDFSLGQTFEQIIKKYGQPDMIEGKNFFYRKGLGGIIDDENGNGSIDNLERLSTVAAFSPFSGKTPKGNGVDSPLKSFEREFGKPEAVKGNIHAWFSKGIAVAEEEGKAEMIFVFQPLLHAAPAAKQGKVKTFFPDLHDLMKRVDSLRKY
ncbi:MAG TPA: PKD domain-containing protein [bacterium (Candidatus Stahlbacteria)]|nr:PKD domain-containing protein [Candidatus Stahlbacteria bacterium]